MEQKRIQLTLFLKDHDAVEIEKVRRKFNPVQYGLIKAHVTLCREDELEQVEKVMANLDQLKNYNPIPIDLGKPVRFSEGKGVFIPVVGVNTRFRQLRENILEGIIADPRDQQPHITLLHPRNAICTDDIFEQIQQADLPQRITLGKISLIEQAIGKEWTVIKEWDL